MGLIVGDGGRCVVAYGLSFVDRRFLRVRLRWPIAVAAVCT